MKNSRKEAVVAAQVENVVEKTTSVESTIEVVETTEVVEPKVAVTLESLKAELQKAAKEMTEKKEQMAAAMKALKEEAKALKELETAQKAEIKRTEAKDRATKMAEALAKLEQDAKVNMTEKIKTMLLDGKSLDDIAVETGWTRKSISDRIWLIEKRLGIR